MTTEQSSAWAKLGTQLALSIAKYKTYGKELKSVSSATKTATKDFDKYTATQAEVQQELDSMIASLDNATNELQAQTNAYSEVSAIHNEPDNLAHLIAAGREPESYLEQLNNGNSGRR